MTDHFAEAERLLTEAEAITREDIRPGGRPSLATHVDLLLRAAAIHARLATTPRNRCICEPVPGGIRPDERCPQHGATP